MTAGVVQLIGGGTNAPPQAVAAGFTDLTFNADFAADGLGILDVNDTADPSYKLYVRSAWTTNSTSLNSFWENVPPNDPGIYSLYTDTVPHFLVCSGATYAIPPGSGQTLTTAIYKATAPGYQGFVFGPGGYIEIKCSTLGTALNNGSWGFYGNAVDWMSDVAGSATTYTEVDVNESGDNVGGASHNRMHATTIWWNPYNTNDPAGFEQNDYLSDGGADVGDAIDDTFHTYGWLWKTRAMNGGTGLLEFYLDDVHQSQCDITYSSSGARSEMDAHRYIMNFVQIQGAYGAVQHIRAWA